MFLRYFRFLTLLLITIFFAGALYADSPLEPVKTDNPRDTMHSFMKAMNDYREGMENNDWKLKSRIDRAVRTMNLNDIPDLLKQEAGQQAAIYLKEVIDRILVVQYDLIPEAQTPSGDVLKRWRLKDTEIVIQRMEEGERTGEYLFSPDTVRRAKSFYDIVKDMPYKEGSGMGAGFQESYFDSIVPRWARDEFFLMPWWKWMGLFTAILIGLLIRTIIRFFIIVTEKLTRRTNITWSMRLVAALKGPTGLLGASLFWMAALKLLIIDGVANTVLTITVRLLISVALIWLAYRAAGYLTDYLESLAAKTESTLDDQLVPVLNRALRVFIVIVGVLIAIQNMGINVMSLLAGLGIGGIAFALAARDTVANFFGSIMILFDSPFQVGDWIRVDNMEGTVEEIGFRSTRIRTFYNSQVSIPNSELMNASIDNMGRREYRRIHTKFGLTYDTSPEKMEAFLEGVKNIIKANPHTRKDYFHVVFSDWGADSLNVMLYAFLKVPDWSTELVERQNIYLEILRLAKEVGVEFAFPTQTLHVESFPEKQPTRTATPGVKEKLKDIARRFSHNGDLSRPEGAGIFVPPYREEGSVPITRGGT